MKIEKKHIPIILFIFVLIIFLLHFFNCSYVIIDNITIILLIFLFLAPLSGSLKKIKWGDFEAEIGENEVKKIEETIKKIPKDKDSQIANKNNITEEIFSVLDYDYVLALAKLRIELEKLLIKIVLTNKDNVDIKRGSFALLRYVETKNLINKDYIPPIKDVLAICNRAVHGEDVSIEVAEKIINIGTDLFNQLQNELSELTTKPIKINIIPKKDVNDYLESIYDVKTIVPLVEKPYLNEYEFNQEQLNSFLEEYNEFAEFIIEIKKR